VAEAFASQPEVTHDVGWGNGTAYRVGHTPGPSIHLDVFPDASVVRSTSTDAQQTLFPQAPPTVDDDPIHFVQTHADG